MRYATVAGGLAAILLGSTALVHAQPTPLQQTTEDPLVAADGATHVAYLAPAEGTGPAGAAGAVWFYLDAQGNTVQWTMEYTGLTPTAVVVVCGEDAASAEAQGDLNLVQDAGLEAPIEGEATGIDQEVFAQMANGECSVIARSAEEGVAIMGVIEMADTGGAGAAAGTAASAQTMMGPAMTAQNPLGTILVGPDGMTLYTWDNDAPGVSNCYGGCATNWPPFYVGDNAAMADETWTVVVRTDDAAMWAYMGQPVYYWIQDMAPGDTTGDGVGGTWHVVIVPEM